MDAVWKHVKVYAKAIWVFAAGVFLPPLIKIFTGEAPLPQTKQEWINWIFTVAGSALAALLVRNKITQSQLDKDPAVVGGTVIDEPKPYTLPYIPGNAGGDPWPTP